jgi:hypothetical protein
MEAFDLRPGSYVVVYLHAPKEKVWGLLVGLTGAGVTVRGLDLAVFDDWMRQEARGEEPLIGLATLFYPMHRVERVEKDETVGPLVGYADRFAREVGRSVRALLGLESGPD